MPLHPFKNKPKVSCPLPLLDHLTARTLLFSRSIEILFSENLWMIMFCGSFKFCPSGPIGDGMRIIKLDEFFIGKLTT